MDIRVSGHQVELGEALQRHVEDRLGQIAQKYFERAISAGVTFGRGPHDSFTCDIISHVMAGLVLKGHDAAQDAHIAFDRAADKIEKQLRRYMRRLQDHHVAAQASLKEEEAAYTVFDGGDLDSEAVEAPTIVAETRVDIPEASVSDAVMLMDLRNTPALLFKNSGTGRHNMVYRRTDGSIGWVEPRAG